MPRTSCRRPSPGSCRRSSAGQGRRWPSGPYLLTSVRNAFYDRTRKDKRLDVTDEVPEDLGRVLAAAAASDDDVERRLAATAFASLPERWQLVLWHTEVEGRSPAEVGPLLGLAPNAVAALALPGPGGAAPGLPERPHPGSTAGRLRGHVPKLGAYVRNDLSNRDRQKVEAHLAGLRAVPGHRGRAARRPGSRLRVVAHPAHRRHPRRGLPRRHRRSAGRRSPRLGQPDRPTGEGRRAPQARRPWRWGRSPPRWAARRRVAGLARAVTGGIRRGDGDHDAGRGRRRVWWRRRGSGGGSSGRCLGRVGGTGGACRRSRRRRRSRGHRRSADCRAERGHRGLDTTVPPDEAPVPATASRARHATAGDHARPRPAATVPDRADHARTHATDHRSRRQPHRQLRQRRVRPTPGLGVAIPVTVGNAAPAGAVSLGPGRLGSTDARRAAAPPGRPGRPAHGHRSRCRTGVDLRRRGQPGVGAARRPRRVLQCVLPPLDRVRASSGLIQLCWRPPWSTSITLQPTIADGAGPPVAGPAARDRRPAAAGRA